jgi:hypothetical protein
MAINNHEQQTAHFIKKKFFWRLWHQHTWPAPSRISSEGGEGE